MVSFTTTTVVALIATAALLIQPCPAPPVFTLVGACSTLLAVPIAIGEGIAEAIKNHKRSIPRPHICPTHPQFSACYLCPIGEYTPTVHVTTNSSVIVDGLLPDCIVQIQDYNAGLDTEKTDAKDGKVVVLNETSIQIDGLPEKIVNKFVEEHLKNHIDGNHEVHPEDAQ
jgi:hypothetical protein